MNDPRAIPRGEKIARVVRLLMQGPRTRREVLRSVQCVSENTFTSLLQDIRRGGWEVRVERDHGDKGELPALFWIDREQPWTT